MITKDINIGDLGSTAAGTAARATGGKMRMDYIPMRVLMDALVVPEHLRIIARYLADFEEGRDDALRTALVCFYNIPDFVRATGEQFDFGAKKYAAWNWAKGMAWSIPLACIKRHMYAIVGGEEFDPESGVAHEGAIGCNLTMLAHFVRHYPNLDDRPPARVFPVAKLEHETDA